MNEHQYRKPKPGDVAEHPLYGWVTIVAQVNAKTVGDTYWLVSKGNLEYPVVAESDLKHIEGTEGGEE